MQEVGGVVNQVEQENSEYAANAKGEGSKAKEADLMGGCPSGKGVAGDGTQWIKAQLDQDRETNMS